MSYTPTSLRFLLATVRSGTTAFLHTVSQHPLIDTASGTMKRYIRSTGRVDYSIYNMQSSLPHVVYRVLFGPKTLQECQYEPFRTAQDIIATKPLFLVREPVTTMNSWKRACYGDLDLFNAAYSHVLRLFEHSRRLSDVRCIAYEYLAVHPGQLFPLIFKYWEIPDAPVLPWKTGLSPSSITLHAIPEERGKLSRHIASGLHDTLLGGPRTYWLSTNPSILPQSTIRTIEDNFGARYREMLELGIQHFPLPVT